MTGALPHAFRKLTSDYVSTFEVQGKQARTRGLRREEQPPPLPHAPVSSCAQMLAIEPEALRLLSAQAMTDIAHLLRPGHLQQLANILEDSEASDNDRFVALELLKNANGQARRRALALSV